MLNGLQSQSRQGGDEDKNPCPLAEIKPEPSSPQTVPLLTELSRLQSMWGILQSHGLSLNLLAQDDYKQNGYCRNCSLQCIAFRNPLYFFAVGITGPWKGCSKPRKHWKFVFRVAKQYCLISLAYCLWNHSLKVPSCTHSAFIQQQGVIQPSIVRQQLKSSFRRSTRAAELSLSLSPPRCISIEFIHYWLFVFSVNYCVRKNER